MSGALSVQDIDLALRVLNVHRSRNSTSPDECAACHRIEAFISNGLVVNAEVPRSDMSAHTKGPWRAGRNGSVVADEPVLEMNGSDAVEYYGGHLIAESIAAKNVPIIVAAPALLTAAEKAERFIRGFEGDELQEGIGELLAELRGAIAKAGSAA